VGELVMMKALVRLCRGLKTNRSGGTAIEYGLIAALIVIAMIASLKMLANVTTGMWNDVNEQVSSAS
jgi:pilus assembly protein Flp/PilA